MTELDRKIYESVPGKQVSMSHIIARPDQRVLTKLGFNNHEYTALGLMTITPGEAAIIAVDIAKKSGDVTIGFVDRFSGSVALLGDVSGVTNAIQVANEFLQEQMGFAICRVTKT